ncbi:hypothetical protein [Hyalangium rubrum]|uniref:SGNH/GDSL hydrolase family protein n=1 Tax=Hyalangium rubrum TaxID=3103134 RepID=A0ABU5GYE2_9BACT|nr:hypothetical protein [Hyalangium sp. s54d21]MDY7226221.1 hypothetical protein [Hyalangium sp. s54d21]
MDRYLKHWAVATAALVLGVLALNMLVDPLWYGRGNRLTRRNYEFNERVSKPNLFLQEPSRYDCIILGSSTSTIIHPSLLEPHRCFNFAFSAGKVSEFIAYAHWLRAQGARPSLVIVGTDYVNFDPRADTLVDVPDFIAKKEAPPPRWKSYLSLDAFLWSVLAAAGQSPYPKFYDERFEVVVHPDAGTFNPDALKLGPRTLDPARASRFAELRAVFPEAHWVGWMPPVSAWHISELERTGTLPGYLRSLHAVSSVLDEVYDFAVPSEVTAEPENTYDGRHYHNAVNARVTGRLAGKEDTFGVRVSGLTFEAYEALYQERLRAFREGASPPVPVSGPSTP